MITDLRKSVQRVDYDPDILQAINVIENTYGVKVSVDTKKKSLIKYGQSDQVQTTNTTLMTNQSGTFNETYVRRNIITHFASGSGNDTMKMTVEGHTVGSDISVSTLTQSSGTATCTTGSSHSYNTGDWVYIEGANEAEYNGIVEITVTGSTTFTYTVDSGASSPATGTITATNQNKTFVVQTVQLAGQTKTALTTPLARCTRAYNPEQNKASNMTGPVYIAQDVTFTSGVPVAASTHCIIPAGKNQTRKASTSLSSLDFWIVTQIHGHMLTKQSAFAEITLEVRQEGGVFRAQDVIAISANGGGQDVPEQPYIVIPANSDVRLVSKADQNGRSVGGSILGYLATVI